MTGAAAGAEGGRAARSPAQRDSGLPIGPDGPHAESRWYTGGLPVR
jgi:hypothetical protein